MITDELEPDEIELFEEKVESLLKVKLPFLDVDSFHEGFEVKKFSHPIGAVLIHYTATDYGDITQGHQTVTYSIEINLLIRSVVQQKGAYRILRVIRKALTGLHIKPLGRVFVKDQSLVEKQGSLWHYVQNFNCIGTI